LVTKEEYYVATKTICNVCKEVFGERLLSVVIYGSVATEDFVPDPVWTDIDFMVILKPMLEIQREEEKGRLEEISLKVAEQQACLRGSSGHALVGYSLETQESLIGKKFNFGYYVVWLNGILDSYKVLHGKDVLDSLRPIPIRKLDALYTLMTTRRHQLMWQTEWKRDKEKEEIGIHEAMPIIKDSIFAAENYLHYNGIHLYRKPEIVKAFLSTFPELDPASLLDRIIKAREDRLSPERETDEVVLLTLAKDSDYFVEDLVTNLGITTLATDPRLWKHLNELLGEASRYISRAIVERAILMKDRNMRGAAEYDKLLDWLRMKQSELEKKARNNGKG